MEKQIYRFAIIDEEVYISDDTYLSVWKVFHILENISMSNQEKCDLFSAIYEGQKRHAVKKLENQDVIKQQEKPQKTFDYSLKKFFGLAVEEEYDEYFPEFFDKLYKIAEKLTPGKLENHKTLLGQQMYWLIGLGGWEHNELGFCDGWHKEFVSIMKKYNLEVNVSPVREVYEAFRIELDPEYREILMKIHLNRPLTEEEQRIFKKVHYKESSR